MKVTLEFDLPEDQESLMLAQNGSAYYAILRSVLEELRAIRKYRSESYTDKELAAYQTIADHIYELLEDRNLIID